MIDLLTASLGQRNGSFQDIPRLLIPRKYEALVCGLREQRVLLHNEPLLDPLKGGPSVSYLHLHGRGCPQRLCCSRSFLSGVLPISPRARIAIGTIGGTLRGFYS